VKQLHDERDALDHLFALSAATSEFMERGLAQRGLSRARASVLWALHRQGPMTQRELSDAVGVTPRNITGLVDALEACGHAVRNPHPSDRRATIVSLTDKGNETMDGVQNGYRESASRLFSDMPEEDLAAFLSVADRLIGRVREHPPARHSTPGRTSPLS